MLLLFVFTTEASPNSNVHFHIDEPCPGFRDLNDPTKVAKGKPGDWICPKCQNINFASRKICHNDKCKGPREGAEPECLSKWAEIQLSNGEPTVVDQESA